MLVHVDSVAYRKLFPVDPNPFISGVFIDLNKHKVTEVLRLISQEEKSIMGLVAGVRDGILKSPFSAPFGGFHFRNENIYISEIDRYLTSLKEFVTSYPLRGVEITLPPNIYHESFNAKVISSLIRIGFHPEIPEITNWVNIDQFGNEFKQKNSREYYRQALRNELSFAIADKHTDKMEIYELIRQNRVRFDRPIYMTMEDIMQMSQIWPVDFFMVNNRDGLLTASAIFYRCHPGICYAVFWGDNETGRPLRAMDYLAYQLWNYYKDMGYKYIDLGISTEQGIPNEGLLRFKESHDAFSSLRYRFTWYVPHGCPDK
jgi:hypothetical protein